MKWIWVGEAAGGRRLSGTESATDEHALSTQLLARGIVLIHSRAAVKASRRTSTRIEHLWPQLSSLLKAGLSVVQALDLLATAGETDGGDSHKGLAELCAELHHQLSQGQSLAQVMRQIGPPFSPLAIGLVAAGEQAGQLDTVLERLAEHSERLMALKRRLLNALLYPVLVLGVSILVVVAMLMLVVPQFERLFAGFGVGLPPLTEAMLWASRQLRYHTLLIMALLLIVGGLGSLLWRAQGRVGQWRDDLQLRTPGLGKVLQHAAVTRISATLSTVLAAGMPLADSLDVVCGVANHRRYRDALLQAKRDVLHGQALHQALRSAGAFPERMLRLTQLGEESGQLPDLLRRVAMTEQAALDQHLSQLMALAEPVMIVVLGGLVALMLVALYLPVFNLAGVMA